MDGDGDALYEEAYKFAGKLTQTVRAAFGQRVGPFHAFGALEASRFTVHQQDPRGIELTVDGTVMLRLTVEYMCTWDHRQEYLAVEHSHVQVVTPAGGEPLFRFDYSRSGNGDIPSAHLQVYGHRDALTYVMTACGRGSRRGKARVKAATMGQRLPRMGDLHFPLGGTRYRPCLEDILQMLADELGVDTEVGALEALADGRGEWRLNQLGAAVRDGPETAAATLRSLGYKVTAPTDGPLPNRIDKLRQP